MGMHSADLVVDLKIFFVLMIRVMTHEGGLPSLTRVHCGLTAGRRKIGILEEITSDLFRALV